MDKDSRNSSKRRKATIITAVPIKVVKQKSDNDLTLATSSSSNSIRRRKTDLDVQSMTWTTTSAQGFVTPYLRLKVKNRRMKHLRTCSKLGDTLLSPSQSYSSSFKSSLSVFAEQVHQRSSKEVAICIYIYWLVYLIHWVLMMCGYLTSVSPSLELDKHTPCVLLDFNFFI